MSDVEAIRKRHARAKVVGSVLGLTQADEDVGALLVLVDALRTERDEARRWVGMKVEAGKLPLPSDWCEDMNGCDRVDGPCLGNPECPRLGSKASAAVDESDSPNWTDRRVAALKARDYVRIHDPRSRLDDAIGSSEGGGAEPRREGGGGA